MCAGQNAGIDVEAAPDSREPRWPDELGLPAATFEERFRQFDRALGDLHDQLQGLSQDVQEGATRPSAPMRRREEGFRGVYTINRDGTQARYLTAAPGMIANVDPQWSHDGTMIAYCAMPAVDTPLQARIFIYAMSGPFKGRIRDFGFGNTPAWSPDDKQIAYMINPGNPIGAQSGAWIMDADGSNRRWICDGFFPRFSPDGQALLCDQGNVTLIVADIASGHTRRLINPPWSLKMYGGNWSPDGRKVVFVGAIEGKDRVATINAQGDQDSIRILHTNDEPNLTVWGPPAWSPDGKQIVWNTGEIESGPRQWWHTYLYSIAADAPLGTKPTLLEGKKVGNINRGPAFSPDGAKIIFSSER
jgi:Tol biopolymer transport system component